MSTQVATYDVFLSYSLPDARAAALVERALEEAGLDVFNAAKVECEGSLEEVLWRAQAESAALVAVVSSQDNLASSVVVEVGAFLAWHKPIYIVRATKASAKLPSYLAQFPAYPVSRIDDVVHAVKRDLQPQRLSDEDRALLISVYVDLGIPTDRLLGQPPSIEELAREFEARSRRRIAGERLVHELLRMRKKGDLPRLHN